jgi:hypothetical protein
MAPLETADIPPTFPDFPSADTVRAFEAGHFMALLSRDLLPISAAGNQDMRQILWYKYALVVMDKTKEGSFRDGFCILVTLEEGMSGRPFVCIFDEHGLHENHGPGDNFYEEDRFVNRALELAGDRLKITEPFREIAKRLTSQTRSKKKSREPQASSASPRLSTSIVAVGAIVVLLMLLFPPWHVEAVRQGVVMSVDRGYHFVLWDPPGRAVTIDHARLLLNAAVAVVTTTIAYTIARIAASK